jgi:hypothetical protein
MQMQKTKNLLLQREGTRSKAVRPLAGGLLRPALPPIGRVDGVGTSAACSRGGNLAQKHKLRQQLKLTMPLRLDIKRQLSARSDRVKSVDM